jgi:hypothetical protein
MPRLGGHQESLGLARILHDMVDDVPEELRAGQLPAAPASVWPQRKGTLAGADPKRGCHD